MARERAEEREAMAAFTLWRLEEPDAGFVIGTAKVDEAAGCAIVRLAHAGCPAPALIATATEILKAAAEMLERDAFAGRLHLLACVEQALDALDFDTSEFAQ